MTFTEGFLESGFEPLSAETYRTEFEAFAALHATADILLGKVGNGPVKLCLGAGLAAVFAEESTHRVTEPGRFEEREVDKRQLRPFVVAHYIVNGLFLSGTVNLIDPTARLDIGLVFNR